MAAPRLAADRPRPARRRAGEARLREQQLTGKRLGEIVVAHGWITPQDLARALAEQNGLEYVDLSETELDREVAMLLPRELATRYEAVPVRFLADDLLLVAVGDPTDIGRCYSSGDVRSPHVLQRRPGQRG